MLTLSLTLIGYRSRVEEMLRKRPCQIHLRLYLGRLLKVRLLNSSIGVILIELNTTRLFAELNSLLGV